MTDRRKAIVAAGYDRLGERYLEWAARVADDPRARFLGEFTRRLPPGSRLLDLGCGSGIPSTRELARVFEVVGVDISGVQIAAACRNVPGASFVHGDVAEIEFPPESFAGVTAMYAISHLPREQRPALFSRIASWLAPGGLLLATLGASDDPDWIGDWLGVEMFFSSYGADTNRRLLLESGFDLLVDEIATIHEPEGPAAFQWILARKAGHRTRGTCDPSRAR
jgi:SAM-dependent methyltransferase